MEYFLSDYSNNILNVFAFFGDAGVTYLLKCCENPLSVQKDMMERRFDRKKSVMDIHRVPKKKKIKRADQILPEVYGTTLNRN